jgi:hypothetical protein
MSKTCSGILSGTFVTCYNGCCMDGNIDRIDANLKVSDEMSLAYCTPFVVRQSWLLMVE